MLVEVMCILCVMIKVINDDSNILAITTATMIDVERLGLSSVSRIKNWLTYNNFVLVRYDREFDQGITFINGHVDLHPYASHMRTTLLPS